MVDKESLQAQLKVLRQNFIDNLPARLEGLESGLAKWRQSLGEQELSEFHRAVHSLTGAGATFGCDELSDVARELEQQLVNPELAKQLDVVEDLLAKVRHAIQNVEPGDAMETEVPYARIQVPVKGRLVYILEDEEEASRNLALQLDHFGYEAEWFTTAEALSNAVQEKKPSLIVADIMLPEGGQAGINMVKSINAGRGEPIPSIFASSRTDLEARLEAVRAGGCAYFEKPLSIESLIDMIDELTAMEMPQPFRCLIVDDSESQASYYANVLMQAGMETRTVSDPMQVLDVINEYAPELVLMDVYMPYCSGIELASVIRQQPAYLGLPIVFLSSETNRNVQLEAMRLGGDDFLTKPIKPSELIASVSIRAERYRLISSSMSQDSLTGLLNHRRLMEGLHNEMARAKRHGGNVTFVMLDIDHFKQVNDNYGHGAGDRVIKSLARLLKQRLRNTDTVGRYGGEEFAMILPQTSLEEAISVVDEVRAHFAALEHYAGEQCFTVTLSGGIATYPPIDHPGALREAADQMLYRAKREGRNRVISTNSAG